MFWLSSYFIWSILCFLILDQNWVSSEVNCPPGHKANPSRTECEPCPDGQYNPKYISKKMCQNCEPCGLYSVLVSPCSRTNNTKCRCFKGFTPLDNSQRRCKCESGRGIKQSGQEKTCEECPQNSFTNKINSVCQPRPRCIQRSEKMPGNATSDINCVDEMKLLVLFSSPLPLTQTSSSTTSMTTARTRNSVSTHTASIPEVQDSGKHALWLAFLVGLLLFILILKLKCPKKNANIVPQGSECGKPIEESGEKFLPPI